jgi:dephospho-CoA kinase
MLIIGITGTNGSGKEEVAKLIVHRKNFIHLSVREFLRREVARRGFKSDRGAMREVANVLRHIYGPGYIVTQLYEIAQIMGKDAVIESIRNPGEIDALETKGTVCIIAVDADPQIRYERIRKRQSDTDQVSFENFLREEEIEMTGDDLNHQNVRACMERVTFTIENNGTLGELETAVDRVMNSLDAILKATTA